MGEHIKGVITKTTWKDEKSDKLKVTDKLLESNYNCSVQDVLSNKTPYTCCAVMIITRSQKFMVSFDDGNQDFLHYQVANLMMRRLYPSSDYFKNSGEPFFDSNNEKNIFVRMSSAEVVIMSPDNRINKFQLDMLTELLQNVRNSDYTISGQIPCIWFRDDDFDFDAFDSILREIEPLELKVPKQFDIGIDFSACKSQKEKAELIMLKAKKLENKIETANRAKSFSDRLKLNFIEIQDREKNNSHLTQDDGR